MNYGFWADLIGVVHTLFLLFVVVGQVLILAGWGLGLAWTRNRAFRYVHLRLELWLWR